MDGLLTRQRPVRAATVPHIHHHANAFTQRGVRMDGLADRLCIRARLNGTRNLTHHVADVVLGYGDFLLPHSAAANAP